MTRIINAILGFLSFGLIFVAVDQNDIITALAMIASLGASVFIESDFSNK